MSIRMHSLLLIAGLGIALFPAAAASQDPLPPEWKKARNAQDRAALDRIAADAQKTASQRSGDAKALYSAGLAEGLRAEVMAEQHDKKGSGAAAESGIKLLEHAISISPNTAEYHRLLGALCGQTVPANILFAMRYGRCAMDEVEKAIQLDPKSALAWLSKGVGNYYLPPQFGGGADKALTDVEKSLQFDSANADAWLWQGIVLRKLNRNADSRKALEKSLSLDPARVWTKQQLEKTPTK